MCYIPVVDVSSYCSFVFDVKMDLSRKLKDATLGSYPDKEAVLKYFLKLTTKIMVRRVYTLPYTLFILISSIIEILCLAFP